MVHIDELDQQCGELNIELTKLVEEKEEIEKVLQETKERCVRTEECLKKQKVRLLVLIYKDRFIICIARTISSSTREKYR